MAPEALTAENIRALYSQVAGEYGLSEIVDSRGYVNISHLFHSPMYVISYVVSNDAAMQLYQMERHQAGSGLSCYNTILSTQPTGFVAFVNEIGLESPFQEGHINAVKTLFESVLNG